MVDWKSNKIREDISTFAMIFVSGKGFFHLHMNFQIIIADILHFASWFSCINARSAFRNSFIVLIGHPNLLLLKLIFGLASNLLNNVVIYLFLSD